MILNLSPNPAIEYERLYGGEALSARADGNGRGGILIRPGEAQTLAAWDENVELTRTILETLSREGREALEKLAAENEAVEQRWIDLSRMGFFAEPPAATAFPIRVQLRLDGMSREETRTLREITERTYGTVPELYFAEDRLDALEERHAEIRDELPPEPTEEPYRIVLETGLYGSEDAFEELFELLDRHWELSIRPRFALPEEGKAVPEKIARLDKEGFLFPVKLQLDADSLESEATRGEAAVTIGELLRGNENRSIELHIERAGFDAVESAEEHYENVEAFFVKLAREEIDLSNISLFKRYFNAILGHRHVFHDLDIGVEGDRVRLTLRSNLEVREEEIPRGNSERFAERLEALRAAIMNPELLATCGACPFELFCKKSLGNDGSREIRRRVLERECRIHKIFFDQCFRTLLEQCGQNRELVAPLKLDIQEDKTFRFSKLG